MDPDAFGAEELQGLIMLVLLVLGLAAWAVGKKIARYRRWERQRILFDPIVAKLRADGRRLPYAAAGILASALLMCQHQTNYPLEAIDLLEESARAANYGRLPLFERYAYELARRALRSDGLGRDGYEIAQPWIQAAESELQRRRLDPDAY